jgi:hypothetical protein
VIRINLTGGPADGRTVILTRTRPPVRFIAFGGAVYIPAGRRYGDAQSWTYTYIGERSELDPDPS